jgi:uncharacterized protein YbjT (DUF2867 family)
MSRSTRPPTDGIEYVTGDLAANQGIAQAVAGAGIIVHCAGTTRGDEDKTRNLVRAAAQAGTPHLVNISVVGADRVPVTSGLDRAMFGYYASKLACERVVAESGLPWTTLRATQFYDLILQIAAPLARLPVIPVPSGVRFQPVDADEVAARFAELALGPPAGLVPDLAGPKVYPMADLIRGYLRAYGKRRPLVPVPLPGRAARAFRDGANLAPDRAVGQRTWEDFLAAKTRTGLFFVLPGGRAGVGVRVGQGLVRGDLRVHALFPGLLAEFAPQVGHGLVDHPPRLGQVRVDQRVVVLDHPPVHHHGVHVAALGLVDHVTVGVQHREHDR